MVCTDLTSNPHKNVLLLVEVRNLAGESRPEVLRWFKVVQPPPQKKSLLKLHNLRETIRDQHKTAQALTMVCVLECSILGKFS